MLRFYFILFIIFILFISLNIDNLWEESDNTTKRNERKVQAMEEKRTNKVVTAGLGPNSERKAKVPTMVKIIFHIG